MQLTVAIVPIFLFQYSYYLKKMNDIMPYIKVSQAAENRGLSARWVRIITKKVKLRVLFMIILLCVILTLWKMSVRFFVLYYYDKYLQYDK